MHAHKLLSIAKPEQATAGRAVTTDATPHERSRHHSSSSRYQHCEAWWLSQFNSQSSLARDASKLLCTSVSLGVVQKLVHVPLVAGATHRVKGHDVVSPGQQLEEVGGKSLAIPPQLRVLGAVVHVVKDVPHHIRLQATPHIHK